MRNTEMCAKSKIHFFQNLDRQSDQFSSGSLLLIETRHEFEVKGIVSNKPWNKYKRYINILNLVSYQNWIESILNRERNTTATHMATSTPYVETTAQASEVTERYTELGSSAILTSNDQTEYETSGVTEANANIITESNDPYMTDTIITIGKTEPKRDATQFPLDISTITESTDSSTKMQFTTEETDITNYKHAADKSFYTEAIKGDVFEEALESNVGKDNITVTESIESGTKSEQSTAENLETSKEINRTNTIISKDASDVFKEPIDSNVNAHAIKVNDLTKSSNNATFTTVYPTTKEIKTSSNIASSEPVLTSGVSRNNSPVKSKFLTTVPSITSENISDKKMVTSEEHLVHDVLKQSETDKMQENDSKIQTEFYCQNGTTAELADDDSNESNVFQETPITSSNECESERGNEDESEPLLKIVAEISPIEGNLTKDDHNVRRVARIFFPFGKNTKFSIP